MILPRIGNPNYMATLLLAKSTPAAPSVTYEAFPAVVVPVLLKAGLSLASPAAVVYGLIPSSLSIITLFSESSSFLVIDS